MRRREMIAGMGSAAASWPMAARAQRMPVIGFFSSIRPLPSALEAFRQGLAKGGYVEGQNVSIEHRWGEGHYERLPALAAELVRRPVDVLVATGGTMAARIAKEATDTIPIVFLSGVDPVEAGLVKSLSRPGGNMTGISQLVIEADEKRLELLHALVPSADRIGYLENPARPGLRKDAERLMGAARALGVALMAVEAGTAPEVEAAFATLARANVAAVLIDSDPFLFLARDQLVTESKRYKLPTMYFFREFVTAGGLASYGTQLKEGYRQVGLYTAKILHGTKPGDLPIIQQSEKIEFVINIKTAKALGLTVPETLITTADEVIE